jgi:hypothetical protein
MLTHVIIQAALKLIIREQKEAMIFLFFSSCTSNYCYLFVLKTLHLGSSLNVRNFGTQQNEDALLETCRIKQQSVCTITDLSSWMPIELMKALIPLDV